MVLLALATPSAAITGILGNTGAVAKVILVILLVFSVYSWAIIFSKWSGFRARKRQTRRFLRALYKSSRLSEVHAASESFRPSPAVEVFEAGYDELERQLRPGASPNLTSVERAMKAETGDQMGLLESRMSWLATIASASPFIGLFGTVWGIMDAFMDLGTAGTATLRAVAPGVSEALITTAAGLFAAIPALIAYNQFVHQIRELSTATDECALEFTSRAAEVLAPAAATAVDRTGVGAH